MLAAEATPLPSRIIVFEACDDGKARWHIIATPKARNLAATGEVILAEEVATWFAETAPKWRNPDPENGRLKRLVADLNLMRVTTESPLRKEGARAEKIEATKRAIGMLQSSLPELITGAHRHRASMLKAGRRPFISEDGVACLEDLLVAAVAAQAVFKQPTATPRTEPWHKAATLIAWHAEEIWRLLGRKDIGPNPTSPLVRLIAIALPRIGERRPAGAEITEETIARELQRARAKPVRPLRFVIPAPQPDG